MAGVSSSGDSGKKRRSFLAEEFGNPERRTAYLMILPTILIVLAIALFPIIYALVLSFTDSTITGVGAFVGIENYVEMFQNSGFREGLYNTVIFTTVAVFFEFIIGLAIALAINRSFRGRGLVRAAVLVPWAFPTIISAVMWRLMFQDQVGVVNWLANDVLGVISQPILSDRTLLLIAAIGVDVWKTTPFMALLLLAGLLTIPEDVYEAARVDGASTMQRFFSITLPLLKPALLVALLFRTLESYRVFDLFWGMSNRELESLSTFVYEGVKISQLQFAQGNAAAVFIFLTAFLLALVFIKGFGMQTSTED
ncbi:MAG: carbohydrate ABC transporter permease [Rubrobacter sp.]